MKYYQNIRKILTKDEILSFLLISLGLILVSVIELFGLSLIIPIIYALISDNFYSGLVSLLNNYGINNFTKDNFLIFTLLIFALLFIFKNILLAFFYWYEGKFIYSVSENISSKIFKQFLNKDYSYHLKENSAELPAKINIELTYIKNFFNGLLTFISEIFIFLGLIIAMLYFSPGNVLKILPIFLISFYLFYVFFNKLIKKIGETRKKNDYLKTKKIQESIGGIVEIITFKKEKYFGNTYDKYIEKLIKVFYKFHFLVKLPRIYFETLAIIAISGFSIIVLSSETNKNEFIAILTIFVVISLRLLPSLNRILTSLNTLRYSYPAAISIGNSVSKVSKQQNKKIKKMEKIKSFKSIKFSNIFFKFPKNNYKMEFNLKIRFGEKIGILGESGSGKTTLINLLLGLYSSNKGNIYLDDKKIKNIDLKNLISYVPQSVYIFDHTILENITFGEYEKSRDKTLIEDSLRFSNSHVFVQKLPFKLLSKTGEAGSKLSQGQRQRLGIARALYNNLPILMLDEITSSLDNNNSSKIISQILKIPNKTIILSTHKPELLKNFDTIIRIKEGNIFLEKNKFREKKYKII